MGLPISTPIIKPVGGLCNLTCSYCYTPKQAGLKCMSEETLRDAVDFFCHDQKYVEFIWHGGEPLLAQIDFYRKAVECQQKWVSTGVRVVNFIQTNATLVTEEWAFFFSQHDFLLALVLMGQRKSITKIAIILMAMDPTPKSCAELKFSVIMGCLMVQFAA